MAETCQPKALPRSTALGKWHHTSKCPEGAADPEFFWPSWRGRLMMTTSFRRSRFRDQFLERFASHFQE